MSPRSEFGSEWDLHKLHVEVQTWGPDALTKLERVRRRWEARVVLPRECPDVVRAHELGHVILWPTILWTRSAWEWMSNLHSYAQEVSSALTGLVGVETQPVFPYTGYPQIQQIATELLLERYLLDHWPSIAERQLQIEGRAPVSYRLWGLLADAELTALAREVIRLARETHTVRRMALPPTVYILPSVVAVPLAFQEFMLRLLELLAYEKRAPSRRRPPQDKEAEAGESAGQQQQQEKEGQHEGQQGKARGQGKGQGKGQAQGRGQGQDRKKAQGSRVSAQQSAPKSQRSASAVSRSRKLQQDEAGQWRLGNRLTDLGNKIDRQFEFSGGVATGIDDDLLTEKVDPTVAAREFHRRLLHKVDNARLGRVKARRAAKIPPVTDIFYRRASRHLCIWWDVSGSIPGPIRRLVAGLAGLEFDQRVHYHFWSNASSTYRPVHRGDPQLYLLGGGTCPVFGPWAREHCSGRAQVCVTDMEWPIPRTGEDFEDLIKLPRNLLVIKWSCSAENMYYSSKQCLEDKRNLYEPHVPGLKILRVVRPSLMGKALIEIAEILNSELA